MSKMLHYPGVEGGEGITIKDVITIKDGITVKKVNRKPLKREKRITINKNRSRNNGEALCG